MKKEDFIDFKNGVRIKKDKIVAWYPYQYKDDKNNKRWVIHFEICRWQSKEFKTKEEAQKWIEKVIYEEENNEKSENKGGIK